ncbi:MATE family efflux transporter [Bacteroides sp.]|uniref:MATE family efflux transporter n=1 Tax=Bacteroides sp. TaxID=29523 RepID=UPI002614953A|nr:MATE family efflux transporter [Bacteroides sp.]MDD3038658.1 MATE family efflux transporter [Bacteroides sp.]
MKDSIDFGSMDISKLFRKLLIPTVLGMVFSAIFVITDGIFVGKGIGSDALAAVNITAPLFMITTGIGLMFGVGASVVASIHLSQGKRKAASINITQALAASAIIILVMSALCFYFVEPLARLLGSSERLMPDVVEYMIWYVPFLVFYVLLNAGMFYIRLDGSPNYAMLCNAVSAVLNIILDYIFIFEFGWGLMGAAFATSLGITVGSLMTIIYLTRYSCCISLCRIKLSKNSMLLTIRNISYMVKLGTSAFISEASIACMMFLGNYVFIRHLGEDGVAAFSIVCYFFPIIFMVYNAIAQSAQPIISYNFGANLHERVRKTLHLSICTALLCGVCFFIITALCSQNIVAVFIDRSYGAFDIAVKGIPYFAIGYIFFAFNMVGIGYYQSIERARRATIITILRGVVFMLIGFFALPPILGVPGIWLAVPLAELLTTLYIIGIYLKDRFFVNL